jgi:hypothetical protein
LGKLKDPLAVPALISACKDNDSTVRQNAIEGLRSINTKEAAKFLISHGVKGVTPVTEQSIQSTDPIHVREIDPLRFQQFQERMKAEQNLPLGIAGGSAAAAVGAVVWALVTVITGYQISWMAIGVGFLVGVALRSSGKGIDKIFGWLGALLALGSCLAGNFLAIAMLIAQQQSMFLGTVLLSMLISPGLSLQLLAEWFSPMDLVFYGLAFYEGYRFSFRQISAAEEEDLYRDRLVAP